jgi:hypothetical protein
MEYSASSRSHLLSPSALLWPPLYPWGRRGRGGKGLALIPAREGRPRSNFSKARAAAIAIIPNEKVTTSPAGRVEPAGRSMLSFIFYVGLEKPLVRAVSRHTRLVSVICGTRNLSRSCRNRGERRAAASFLHSRRYRSRDDLDNIIPSRDIPREKERDGPRGTSCE